jgi:hypothetical protein
VIAHGHLAIGDEHGFIVLAHQKHSGAVHPYALEAILHSAIIPHPPVRLEVPAEHAF